MMVGVLYLPHKEKSSREDPSFVGMTKNESSLRCTFAFFACPTLSFRRARNKKNSLENSLRCSFALFACPTLLFRRARNKKIATPHCRAVSNPWRLSRRKCSNSTILFQEIPSVIFYRLVIKCSGSL